MTFRQREVDTNVNLPSSHPLKDMAWMLGGLLLITVALFMLSGLLVDRLVKYVPSSLDNKIAEQLDAATTASLGQEITEGELYRATHDLFLKIRPYLPQDDDRQYRLKIIDEDTVNAMAAPGGIIYIYKGLLDQVASENELAMIMAHEYGHVYLKHHWKRLGRGILFSLVMSVITGNQNSLQKKLTLTPANALISDHGRAEESDSDHFALRIVCSMYGHRGGATDFFARHVDADPSSSASIQSFFATHPMSATRVEDIRHWANELECDDGRTTPLLD